MNNDPSPLIPQGSLQQASAKSKSTMRLAIFIVAIVHVALIGGILMVGCKREEAKPDPAKQAQVQNNLPPLDPTYYPPASNDPAAGVMPPDPLGGSLPPLPPPAGTTLTSAPPSVGGTVPGGTAMDPLLPPPAVPGNMLPPEPAPVAEGVTYSIAKGDTFSSIASRKGVSVAAIVKANPGVDPTRLQIGQKIKLPAGAAGSVAAAAAPSTTPSTSASASYTVKSGDTLTRIARNHNTTVAALKSANGLRTDRINVGQKLKVPGVAKPAATPSAGPAVATPPLDPLGGALPPLPAPGNP